MVETHLPLVVTVKNYLVVFCRDISLNVITCSLNVFISIVNTAILCMLQFYAVCNLFMS